MVLRLDTLQWRVYTAEQAVPAGAPFDELAEAQTFLWWIQSTRWWSDTFPGAPRIELQETGGYELDEHTVTSFAKPSSEARDAAWRISLHRSMMLPLVILHEVAHCVNPRTFGDLAAVRRGRVAMGRHHQHGPMFTAAYAALAQRYMQGTEVSLRDAFEHFEVPVATLAELQQARVDSDAIEDAWAEVAAAHEETTGSDPTRLARLTALAAERDAARPAGTTHAAPVMGWGYWIRSARRHRFGVPIVSQRALADTISGMVPCSVATIARLERMPHRPTERRDLVIALVIAAVLELDPLRVRTDLELWPGDELPTLDELRDVAPGWVANIEHLLALAEARLSVWVLETNR